MARREQIGGEVDSGRGGAGGHARHEPASAELRWDNARDSLYGGARTLGRYHLIETLGRGGMGTIHLAVVGGLGRFRKLFVLKVLRDDLTQDARFVEMFMREAALAACLNHPNVVQTVEAQQDGGRFFLVMEFLDGQPFSKLLRTASHDPIMPLGLRLRVLCNALAGLHYAHEVTDYDGQALQMVHCDVSPPNVFVTYDGQVKLLDFGIAKARDMTASKPGEFTGKLGYAAPEQLRGTRPDRRLDVFGAGVVLWEAIALRHIAHGKTPPQMIAARLSGTEPRIAQVVPDVDPALAAICDRAMDPDPELRFPSAEAFRRALEAYLEERDPGADAAALARYMRAKFAEERATMHRLIDAHVRWGTDGDSSLVALRSGAIQLPEQAPEASAARVRPQRPEEEESAIVGALRPRSHNARRIGIASVVALALAVPLALLRSEGSEESGDARPAPPTSPPSQQARPAAREAPVTAPFTPPPAPTEPASDAQRARTSPLEPTRAAPPASRQPPAQEEGATADAPKLEGAARSRSARGASRHASAAETVRPGTSDAAVRDEPSTPRDAGPRAGEPLDLRSVRKREPRPLDLDNPFR